MAASDLEFASSEQPRKRLRRSIKSGARPDSAPALGLISVPVPGLSHGGAELPPRQDFSDLLPSLVLKGDVLELNMVLLKDPESKFRPFAAKLLAQI
jgi:hypothetical protein